MVVLKPYIFNAASAAINSSMVMSAIAAGQGRITEAVAHDAQIISWVNFSIAVGAVKFKADQFPGFPLTQLTLGGIPLRRDDTNQLSEVQFLDRDGNVVSKIEALGIPMAFVTSVESGATESGGMGDLGIPEQAGSQQRSPLRKAD